MRARAAYISSVGTTSILVVSAVLLLAVVSALVAFRGWPGHTAGDAVASVPVESSAPPVDVRRVAKLPVVRARRVSAVAHAVVTRRLSTAGLVKDPIARGRAIDGVVAVEGPRMTPVQQAAPQPPPPPVVAPEPPAPPSTPDLPVPPGDLDPVIGGLVDTVTPPAGTESPVMIDAQPGELTVAVGQTSVGVAFP
jgi:hypothetical protein